jgi:hypothetical protein
MNVQKKKSERFKIRNSSVHYIRNVCDNSDLKAATPVTKTVRKETHKKIVTNNGK